MKMIFEILTWTVMAAALVYVIMNASRIAVAVTTLGNWSSSEQGILMGSAA